MFSLGYFIWSGCFSEFLFLLSIIIQNVSPRAHPSRLKKLKFRAAKKRRWFQFLSSRSRVPLLATYQRVIGNYLIYFVFPIGYCWDQTAATNRRTQTPSVRFHTFSAVSSRGWYQSSGSDADPTVRTRPSRHTAPTSRVKSDWCQQRRTTAHVVKYVKQSRLRPAKAGAFGPSWARTFTTAKFQQLSYKDPRFLWHKKNSTPHAKQLYNRALLATSTIMSTAYYRLTNGFNGLSWSLDVWHPRLEHCFHRQVLRPILETCSSPWQL